MLAPTINYLTNIYFDVRAGHALSTLRADFGIERPLVITDPTLVRLDILDRINLDPPALFDQVQTNPSESSAKKAVELYRTRACDGLVAVGGGSSIDLAKAVGLLVNHEPPLAQYALIHGGRDRIREKLPPLIAIPTTAGSGSEVGRAALITLGSGDKLALISPKLIPSAAVCDPDLTCTMPAALTAATGMDAISHCVETFCSPEDNPIADAIALDGLERAWSNIRGVIADPNNRPNRREMMLAALAGGLCFQKGLGAVHSLSHPLGAIPQERLHHGTLNAIFLPHVLRFNFDSCREKMAAMAQRMGMNDDKELPDAFGRLLTDLALPSRLRDLGLIAEDLEPLVSKALADHCTQTNPRTMSAADAASLYWAAL